MLLMIAESLDSIWISFYSVDFECLWIGSNQIPFVPR